MLQASSPWAGRARAELETKVKELTAENLGVRLDELEPTADLRDTLGADSLDVIELALDLEREFEVDIPDELSEEFRTFGDLVDAVYAAVNKVTPVPQSEPQLPKCANAGESGLSTKPVALVHSRKELPNQFSVQAHAINSKFALNINQQSLDNVSSARMLKELVLNRLAMAISQDLVKILKINPSLIEVDVQVWLE